MANPVMIDIPGVGQIEAKNAATESTLRDLVNAINNLNKATQNAAKASAKSSTGPNTPGAGGTNPKAAANAANALAKGLGGATKSLSAMAFGAGKVAQTLLNTAAGASKLVKQLSNVDDSLTGAADSFRMLGPAGDALATIFGAVASAAEKTVKAYNQAAGAGADFGGSMMEFSRSASAAGMTLDQYGALVKANSESMLAFGQTVGDGAKRFSNVSKQLRTTSDGLYALGFSTQDINEGLAGYGKQLRLQGRQGTQTNAELAAGAKAYLTEMDLLAKVTGESRKAQEDARQRLLNDAQFQGKIASMEKKDAEALSNTINGLPPGLRDVTKDIMVTGTATTEESRKFMALMPKSAELMQKYAAITDKGGTVTLAMQQELQNTLRMEGIATKKQYESVGKFNKDLAGTYMQVVQASNINKDALKEATAEQKKAAEDNDKVNKTVQEMQQRIAAVSNKFTSLLVDTGMLDGLMAGFELLSSSIETFIVPVMKVFGWIISDTVRIISAVLTPIVKILGFAFNGLVDTIGFVRNFIGKTFGSTLKWINKTFEDLIAPLKTLWWGIESLSDVTDLLSIKWDEFTLFMKEMIFAIRDFIPGLEDTSKAERDQLAAEKAELANKRLSLDNKIARQAEKNQKEFAAREDKLWNKREDREREAESKETKSYDDALSLLKDQMGTKGTSAASAAGRMAGVPSAVAHEGLGGLSAKYESGGKGSEAIGWDSTGGTSYGKYQIATKTGTMNRFMDFLKTNNPEAYERLSKAGPADAGKDGAFAKEWQALAKSGKLGGSEHEFIKKTHYDVGMGGIKDKSLQGMIEKSKALQEVMWSSSVQHGGGGASKMFNKVFKEGMSEQDLIKAVYAERGTKFGSSSAGVQASVQRRFAEEQQLALGMAGQPGYAVAATSPNRTATPTSGSVASTVAQSPQQTAKTGTQTPGAVGATGQPAQPPTTQESAETLLASLNNKMDQLIKHAAQTTTNTYQQVQATQSLSGDLYKAV